MTKYVICGASAFIGQRTVDGLLRLEAPQNITLLSRNPTKLACYSERNVRVLTGSYATTEILRTAFEGAQRLFLISGINVGERIKEHRTAIELAKEAGIEHITYTSVAAVHPSNTTPSSIEHLATERMLQESGLNFTILRNQYYSDIVYQVLQDNVLATNRWVQNNEIGHIVPVSRNDIADCATAIMLNPIPHERVIYEVTGPERFTFPQIAQLASQLWNQPIQYMPVTDETMREIFEKIGVTPDGDDSSTSLAHKFGFEELIPQCQAYESGLYDLLSGHVEFITGRKAETLESTLRRLIEENKND